MDLRNRDMTNEEYNVVYKLGKSEAYQEMSFVLGGLCDKSMKRWLWFLRPSHTQIMKIWEIILEKW